MIQGRAGGFGGCSRVNVTSRLALLYREGNKSSRNLLSSIPVHQELKFLPHSGHLSLLALRSYPHPSHLPSPIRGLRPRTITYPHIAAKNKNTNGRIADAPGSGG